MQIDIDENSGFCFGVKRAIELAEQSVSKGEKVYCLGEIVHNAEEVKRLEELGMVTVTYSDLPKLSNVKVLFRAHGESPSVYSHVKQSSNDLTDGTCPIVASIQKKVHKAWEEAQKVKGQIVIFGKEGHAEVNGLVGQTNSQAIVISKLDDLAKIDFTRPVSLFSQTTMDAADYAKISEVIQQKLQENMRVAENDFVKHNTICGHVSGRAEKLRNFAANYDVVVFVSGKNSSNGKVLFEVCKQHNSQTFWVANTSQIEESWFTNAFKVGICGATSTPRWLMEDVANKIRLLKNN